MEPMTTILTAIIAGATTAATGVADQTVRDAYADLKQSVIDKLGDKADLENAIQQVEGKPRSVSRQNVLQEELESAITTDPAAVQDQALLAKAQHLLAFLQQHSYPPKATMQITQSSSGGLAYGPEAKAAGEQGVVADTIHGPVATGDQTRQVQSNHYIEQAEGTVIFAEAGATVIMGEAPVAMHAVARESALGHYLRHVISHHHYLQLQGIRAGGKLVHIELDRIYIRLRTTQERRAQSAPEVEDEWLQQTAWLAPGESPIFLTPGCAPATP